MEFADKIVIKLKKKYGINGAEVAIVVGSGQMGAMPGLENVKKIPYEELGMPKSKVKGHSGSFTFGMYNGKIVVLVSRIHYYECGDIKKVRLPYEVISRLGVKRIVLLTSAGGVNRGFKVGDIMLIKDHINLSGVNPMVGIDNMRFVSMQNCYNADLTNQIKNIAYEEDIDLRDGIFCQMSGPSYETNAEIEMLRVMGVDAVSMSTAMDCIISNYLDMSVAGFAIIVNVYGSENNDVNHEGVLANAELACTKLKAILERFI